MLYWIFTDGREFLSSLLLPLLCLTLLLPPLVSAAFGAGIQRSESNDGHGWQRVALVCTFVVVLIGITALYLTLLGDLAIQPARGRQTTSAVIQIVVGAPRSINTLRLFLFGIMLTLAWLVVSIGLHNGIRNGGWLRERIDRLRVPQVKRGALGSSHFCTMREYRRFRRDDTEGLTLLGAFWGEEKRRLDQGYGRFSLSGEDIARGILTLGGPGSGKTQGIILPAIRRRASSCLLSPTGCWQGIRWWWLTRRVKSPHTFSSMRLSRDIWSSYMTRPALLDHVTTWRKASRMCPTHVRLPMCWCHPRRGITASGRTAPLRYWQPA